MYNLNINHLKTLVALRDGETLVEASRHLHVTQSALSHQIKDLEERLGLELFVRKSRPIRFTRAGLEILAAADEILPKLAHTERNLKKIATGESGRLNMAIECHSCFDWLMPAINQFRESWPEVEVDLSTSFHFEALEALIRGDIDLVITSDNQPHPQVHYWPLFHYQALLAISKQHSLVNKKSIEPKDLKQETLIHYPVERSRLDIFTQFLEPENIEPKEVRLTELTMMMIQLVASGRGVACLPNWALQPYQEANLITTKPLGEGVWPTMYAAINVNHKNTAFMQDFFEFASQTCFRDLTGILPVSQK